MQITDVRIHKLNKDTSLKAVASITIDNAFVVHDIKVIESDKGRFIAMPSRKGGENNFIDIAHPINQETRNEITNKILEAYDKIDGEQAQTEESPQ